MKLLCLFRRRNLCSWRFLTLSLLKLFCWSSLCELLSWNICFSALSDVTVSLSSRMGVQSVVFPTPFAHRLECVQAKRVETSEASPEPGSPFLQGDFPCWKCCRAQQHSVVHRGIWSWSLELILFQDAVGRFWVLGSKCLCLSLKFPEVPIFWAAAQLLFGVLNLWTVWITWMYSREVLGMGCPSGEPA